MILLLAMLITALPVKITEANVATEKVSPGTFWTTMRNVDFHSTLSKESHKTQVGNGTSKVQKTMTNVDVQSTLNKESHKTQPGNGSCKISAEVQPEFQKVMTNADIPSTLGNESHQTEVGNSSSNPSAEVRPGFQPTLNEVLQMSNTAISHVTQVHHFNLVTANEPPTASNSIVQTTSSYAITMNDTEHSSEPQTNEGETWHATHVENQSALSETLKTTQSQPTAIESMRIGDSSEIPSHEEDLSQVLNVLLQSLASETNESQSASVESVGIGYSTTAETFDYYDYYEVIKNIDENKKSDYIIYSTGYSKEEKSDGTSTLCGSEFTENHGQILYKHGDNIEKDSQGQKCFYFILSNKDDVTIRFLKLYLLDDYECSSEFITFACVTKTTAVTTPMYCGDITPTAILLRSCDYIRIQLFRDPYSIEGEFTIEYTFGHNDDENVLVFDAEMVSYYNRYTDCKYNCQMNCGTRTQYQPLIGYSSGYTVKCSPLLLLPSLIIQLLHGMSRQLLTL